MTEQNELIPLVNVTDGGEEALERARGVLAAEEKLRTAEQFCLVTISKPDDKGQQNIDAQVGASDHGMLTMVVTMLGLIGAQRLGPAGSTMPADVARAIAQSLGFEELNRFLRQQSEQALAALDPRTPAKDAGAPPTEH